MHKRNASHRSHRTRKTQRSKSHGSDRPRRRTRSGPPRRTGCSLRRRPSLLPVRAVVVVASACRHLPAAPRLGSPCFPCAPWWWWWHLPAAPRLASPRRLLQVHVESKKRKMDTRGPRLVSLEGILFSIKFFAGVFFGRLGKKEKSRPRSDQPRTSYLLVGSRLRLKACACSSSDEVTSFVSHHCLLIQTVQTIAKLANLVIVPPGEFEKSTCGVTGDTDEERVRGTK